MKIKILLLILFYASILEAQTFEGRLMYTFIIDNGTQIPEQGISDYFLNMQQGQIEYFIKEDTLLGVVTNRKGDFLYIEKQIGKNMSMINEFGKEVDLNGVANSLDFELEKRTKESTEMLGLTAHKVILNDKHIYFEKPTFIYHINPSFSNSRFTLLTFDCATTRAFLVS